MDESQTPIRREQYLDKLAGRTDAAWAELQGLFHRKKDGRALRLLLDLSAVAARSGDAKDYLARVRQLDESYPLRQTRFGMPSRQRLMEMPSTPAVAPPRAADKSAPPEPATARTGKNKKQRPKNDIDALWAEAKKKCRLNAATIAAAKELGMHPRSLLKNIPSPSQQWKAPVHLWIRELHAKRFGSSTDIWRDELRGSTPVEPPMVNAWDDDDIPF